MTDQSQSPPLDPAAERQLAVDLFNFTWTLLDAPSRTPEQDDEMLHAAHASRHHWGHVGGVEHLARGEWQCSRVYAVLGRAEPALHHARRCLEICEANGLADFDLAAAYEALARAASVAGDATARVRWLGRALEACREIADDDDREVIQKDLDEIAAS